MASIGSSYWKNVWKQILQIGPSNTGLSASMQSVQDGAGNSSGLGLSTDTTKIQVNGYDVTATASSSIGGTNTGDQLVFKTISVSGQSDVVADSITDTLTLVAGTGVTITTNASTDTITIASSSGGGLIGVQVFTSGSGTYTPTSGMGHIIVQMVGGGQGGGAVTGAGAYGVGAGGNAGNYLEFMMTSAQVGSSKSYGVGAGNSGGNGGTGSNGTNGGNTTFADWTATGGNGGGLSAAGTTAPTVSSISVGNNSASTVGTGTVIVNMQGGISDGGFAISTPLGKMSAGGISKLAVATTSVLNKFLVTTGSTAGGNYGTNSYGCGGSGAICVNNTAATNGGTGIGGIIIVYEFA